jgi:hypothetical protein
LNRGDSQWVVNYSAENGSVTSGEALANPYETRMQSFSTVWLNGTELGDSQDHVN